MLSGKLGSFMHRSDKDKHYYQAGRILCVELSLCFQSSKDKLKNKFIVLLDDKEPPLFFLINSRPRGLNNNLHIELHKKNYSFLTNEISFLNFNSTFADYDEVKSLPSRQEFLDLIDSEPNRYKGTLNKEDAKELLFGVENYSTAIEPIDLERIITGLRQFLESDI